MEQWRALVHMEITVRFLYNAGNFWTSLIVWFFNKDSALWYLVIIFYLDFSCQLSVEPLSVSEIIAVMMNMEPRNV